MNNLSHILETAEAFIGVKEIRGPKHNPTILAWLKLFAKNIGKWGKSRDETAWCAVFVSMVLNTCGYKGTDHALASSYIDWGKPSRPVPGAIVVIKRKKKGRDAATGSRAGYHVGVLKKLGKHFITIVGGNQGNAVTTAHFSRANYNIIALRRPSELG